MRTLIRKDGFPGNRWKKDSPHQGGRVLKSIEFEPKKAPITKAGETQCISTGSRMLSQNQVDKGKPSHKSSDKPGKHEHRIEAVGVGTGTTKGRGQ